MTRKCASQRLPKSSQNGAKIIKKFVQNLIKESMCFCIACLLDFCRLLVVKLIENWLKIGTRRRITANKPTATTYCKNQHKINVFLDPVALLFTNCGKKTVNLVLEFDPCFYWCFADFGWFWETFSGSKWCQNGATNPSKNWWIFESLLEWPGEPLGGHRGAKRPPKWWLDEFGPAECAKPLPGFFTSL